MGVPLDRIDYVGDAVAVRGAVLGTLILWIVVGHLGDDQDLIVGEEDGMKIHRGIWLFIERRNGGVNLPSTVLLMETSPSCFIKGTDSPLTSI